MWAETVGKPGHPSCGWFLAQGAALCMAGGSGAELPKSMSWLLLFIAFSCFRAPSIFF